MATTAISSDVLTAAIQGDLEAYRVLAKQPHTWMETCAASLPTLVLSTDGVRTVLLELREGRVSPSEAQEWASFVRRGYIAAREVGPVSPIDINYDPRDEELVAHTVSRLDELGDVVDGQTSVHELDTLIRALSPDG